MKIIKYKIKYIIIKKICKNIFFPVMHNIYYLTTVT